MVLKDNMRPFPDGMDVNAWPTLVITDWNLSNQILASCFELA